MKILRIFLIGIAALAFSAGLLSESAAQRKRGDFSHNTKEHKKNDCNFCHKNPTPNWAAVRGYPDVADYPGHASCIGCHRRDFFAGNRPAICAGCHVNPGPRGAARLRFPGDSLSTEFSTRFPHNVHQDIIASNRREVAVAHFVNASFTTADDPPEFNNCAICHATRDKLPAYSSRKLTALSPLGDAATDAFVPTAGFFKAMPSGHTTCFACHFQNVKPTGTDCAGCHNLTAAYTDTAKVERYSLKFDHGQKEHALRDCMTCHVRIAQNTEVAKMKDADVPFMACVSCHSDKLLEEAGKRATTIKDGTPAFQCSYCHTTEVGRFPIPKSHQGQ